MASLHDIAHAAVMSVPDRGELLPMTSIVATLGFASNTVDTITELIKSGVTIFRINMSHSNGELATPYIENVRAAAERSQGACGDCH